MVSEGNESERKFHAIWGRCLCVTCLMWPPGVLYVAKTSVLYNQVVVLCNQVVLWHKDRCVMIGQRQVYFWSVKQTYRQYQIIITISAHHSNPQTHMRRGGVWHFVGRWRWWWWWVPGLAWVKRLLRVAVKGGVRDGLLRLYPSRRLPPIGSSCKDVVMAALCVTGRP